MAKVSEAFPSKYLRAADLHGKKRTVTMERVELEEIKEGEGEKMILYFEGLEKGLVLNKTNASELSSFVDDDTDNWAGEEICLYPAKVQYSGKMVDAIRVSVRKADIAEGKANRKANNKKRDNDDEGGEEDKPAAAKGGKKGGKSTRASADDDIPF